MTIRGNISRHFAALALATLTTASSLVALSQPAEAATTVCATTIQYGATGSCVTKLQTRLNELGGGLAVDGDFGAGTRKAVWAFQGRAQIGMDGVVGPTTQAKLNVGAASIANTSVATITAYINTRFGSAAALANKVATCESSKIETNIGLNTNGTYDMGVFQVNTVHGNTAAFRASMLNYKSNIDYAYTLYASQGWTPWNSSKGCWG